MNKKTLKKPSPDFPLTAHPSGYWVKKIRGRQQYIGDRWALPEDVLREWNRIKDRLLAGENPPPDPKALTLRDAMNYFLCDREQRVQTSEITQRTFDDYVKECKNVVKVLGKDRIVQDLTAQDFNHLKAQLPSRSPNTLGNHVARIKIAFKYLYDAALIDQPVRFGPSFKRPSAKSIRLHRAKQPKKLFTAADVQLLVANAKPQLKAMILLGVNCGFGNNDCGSLTIEKLNGEWHNYERPKTGIERRAWLWPETRAALSEAIGIRTEGLCFITKYGKPWAKAGNAHPISAEFKKLRNQLGIQQTFYALRHTFETIAGNAKDQVAVDYVMGHVPTGMAAMYREEIPDERLKAVCEEVRQWYLK